MADDPMMEEHLTTWHYFCGLIKWSLILIIIVLVLMGIFLV
ncbi:MAG: aa3-type cytochrome c oxidase subunit IV [Pseudomonadota bacterium]